MSLNSRLLFLLAGFVMGIGIMNLFFELTKRMPPPVLLTQEQLEQQKQDAWINEKIASMSAEERVGQILMWHIEEKDLSTPTAKLLNDIPFGGVIIMGNHTKDSLKNLIDQIHTIPSVVPRFIAIDQEGGPVKRLTEDTNPGARKLSETSLTEFCDAYNKTANDLTQAGVNMNFGIIADIGWFQDGYITPRTFGKNATLASDLVGRAATCSTKILTAVKHFPGHGRTKLDSHNTIPVIKTPLDEWKESDALPFQKAIDEKIPVVMLGHLVYDQMASEPASLSPYWVQTLRGMGHNGLIVTDDLGMFKNSDMSLEKSVQQAIHANVDLLLFASNAYKADEVFRIALSQIQKERTVSDSFDNSVRRILRAKYTQLVQ